MLAISVESCTIWASKVGAPVEEAAIVSERGFDHHGARQPIAHSQM
jgi:hypothetical protein